MRLQSLGQVDPNVPRPASTHGITVEKPVRGDAVVDTRVVADVSTLPEQVQTTASSAPGGVGAKTLAAALTMPAAALAIRTAGDVEVPMQATQVRSGITLQSPLPGESTIQYLERTEGQVSTRSWQQIIGAAGPYKDGDEAIGVSAGDEATRDYARQLLSNTRLADLQRHPLHDDAVSQFIRTTTDPKVSDRLSDWTVGDLKNFVLRAPDSEIHAIMPGLDSDAIASIVKLMSNDELVAVGQKVFNPLPGSHIGAKGYLGARVQPNSPTDHPDDVTWQVLNAWSFAVGDVMLGTNPVGSTVPAVKGVETALQDLVCSFGLQDHLPWVVLSHIDVQDQVEKAHPGSTTLFFQSIAGTESANQVFDISVPKMMRYASERKGQYGLYLETGQGADFTNGQDHGVDMGTLESRKYGFARGLKQMMGPQAWVATNDVAGFIGPEVFKSKEQLVRVALEDTIMGKLHGLTIGLDICSTLHMPINQADLDWAIDHIMPANPAYLMALPTKNDPMLSYLTTAFQDHVRIREQFGYKVNEPMWAFFQKLGVIDEAGQPTEHFGDPLWVYVKYRQAKGDVRPVADIHEEGRQKSREVAQRGVSLAHGTGDKAWELNPQLKQETDGLVEAAKKSIWSELTPQFVSAIPQAIELQTRSADRSDYILHPPTGETLHPSSVERVQQLASQRQPGQFDVQVVVSDGLNAEAISDTGHLAPFLTSLRDSLSAHGQRVAPETLVMHNGRVRAGYRLGEMLFGQDASPGPKTVVHVIGERPGTRHNNYSVYVATAPHSVWSQAGTLDHDRVTVVSGISDTALDPTLAARQTSDRIAEATRRNVC